VAESDLMPREEMSLGGLNFCTGAGFTGVDFGFWAKAVVSMAEKPTDSKSLTIDTMVSVLIKLQRIFTAISMQFYFN
jgi:hypothetical protein